MKVIYVVYLQGANFGERKGELNSLAEAEAFIRAQPHDKSCYSIHEIRETETIQDTANALNKIFGM